MLEKARIPEDCQSLERNSAREWGFGTSAVGAPNLAAGLRDAYLGCSPVIAVTDGPRRESRYRHQAELERAARLGLNTVTVVNNNRSLSHPRRNVEAPYGGPHRGRAHETWVYNETNFAALAEVRGCLGLRVERPGDLQEVLERAFAANRPAVIDVVTEVDGIVPRAWG